MLDWIGDPNAWVALATLTALDPDCEGLRVSSSPQIPRGDTALILCRGFAGTNAALIIRALQ